MVGDDDGRIWRGFDGGALAADVFSILGDGGQAEPGAAAHAGFGGRVGGGVDLCVGDDAVGVAEGAGEGADRGEEWGGGAGEVRGWVRGRGKAIEGDVAQEVEWGLQWVGEGG